MAAATIPGKGRDNKPWYKHRWPWLLMVGPFVVVVAGVITTYLAVSGQDALVVDDYYKEGKAINQDLRRDTMAAKLQLEAELRFDAAAGALAGRVESRKQPYAGKVFVNLVHSTQPGKDLKLIAEVGPDGAFSVPLAMLDIARWRVVIEGEKRDWRLAGDWIWPQNRQITLVPAAPSAEN